MALYELNNKPPYQNITELAERKNIFIDKSQNIFDRDMQKLLARLYFNSGKYSQAEIIYKNFKDNTLFEKSFEFRKNTINKAFIEKPPDNVIENFKIQEQEIKSSIEKVY